MGGLTFQPPPAVFLSDVSILPHKGELALMKKIKIYSGDKYICSVFGRRVRGII